MLPTREQPQSNPTLEAQTIITKLANNLNLNAASLSLPPTTNFESIRLNLTTFSSSLVNPVPFDFVPSDIPVLTIIQDRLVLIEEKPSSEPDLRSENISLLDAVEIIRQDSDPNSIQNTKIILQSKKVPGFSLQAEVEIVKGELRRISLVNTIKVAKPDIT